MYTSEISVGKIKVNEELGIWLYQSQLIDTLFLTDKEALQIKGSYHEMSKEHECIIRTMHKEPKTHTRNGIARENTFQRLELRRPEMELSG